MLLLLGPENNYLLRGIQLYFLITIYYKLIEFIRSKDGYIDVSPVDFL
jgi:hypothetical protein